MTDYNSMDYPAQRDFVKELAVACRKAGLGYELDAIAAVVVGGTSMSGGRGSILGTVLGMLIIAVMNNLLNLMGVPPFLREAFKGFIVIAAVLLQKKEATA